MSAWLDDERRILGAKFAGNGEWYRTTTGDCFERIEHPGEFCMLPWLRVTTWKAGYEATIEAPLTQIEFINYAAIAQNPPETSDE